MYEPVLAFLEGVGHSVDGIITACETCIELDLLVLDIAKYKGGISELSLHEVL